MSAQDERTIAEPAAPDPELLRAALRATESRIARSSAPPPDHAVVTHAATRPVSFHPADDVAAVEHRVDHLAESFGEAMQAHARFRTWVTAAIEDLSARVLGAHPAGAGHELGPEVLGRLDDLAARLDAFDEQAARMVTYLTGLAEELQRRMDRVEATLVEPVHTPGRATPEHASPEHASPGHASPEHGLPRITLRPIMPSPDAHRAHDAPSP